VPKTEMRVPKDWDACAKRLGCVCKSLTYARLTVLLMISGDIVFCCQIKSSSNVCGPILLRVLLFICIYVCTENK